MKELEGLSRREILLLTKAIKNKLDVKKVLERMTVLGWKYKEKFGTDEIIYNFSRADDDEFPFINFDIRFNLFADSESGYFSFLKKPGEDICEMLESWKPALASMEWTLFEIRQGLMESFKSFVYDIRELDFIENEIGGNNPYSKGMKERVRTVYEGKGWRYVYEGLGDNVSYKIIPKKESIYIKRMSLYEVHLFSRGAEFIFAINTDEFESDEPYAILKWIDAHKDEVIERIFYGDESPIESKYIDRLNEIYYLNAWTVFRQNTRLPKDNYKDLDIVRFVCKVRRYRDQLESELRTAATCPDNIFEIYN